MLTVKKLDDILITKILIN